MAALRGEHGLTKKAQYALVYRQGGSWASNLVVLRAVPNGLDAYRYGFSVSRRVGNAVTRNRIKRLFREIIRRQSVKPGWDMVFIARAGAAGAGYDDLRKAVQALLARGGLLTGEDEKVGSGSN